MIIEKCPGVVQWGAQFEAEGSEEAEGLTDN